MFLVVNLNSVELYILTDDEYRGYLMSMVKRLPRVIESEIHAMFQKKFSYINMSKNIKLTEKPIQVKYIVVKFTKTLR